MLPIMVPFSFEKRKVSSSWQSWRLDRYKESLPKAAIKNSSWKRTLKTKVIIRA
jgi:hypothetical protein